MEMASSVQVRLSHRFFHSILCSSDLFFRFKIRENWVMVC